MALTDLDTRVALAVQTPQVDFNQLLNNSLDTYNTVKGMGQQGILSRLLAQNTGADGQVNLAGALQSAQTNPNQAYQSGMVNTLSGLIQQQNAVKLKAQQEAEKQRIDNAKTVAETRDKELGNTQKGQSLLSNLIATSTDATDAAKKLEILGSQYGLPPETIEATKAQLTGLAANNQGGPDAFENMRKSYGLLGAEKPIEYMQPTANTVANNEASNANNIRDNQTKVLGIETDAKTATNKLEQDKILAEQQLAFKNSEFDVEQGVDGVTYAVYKSGPNAGKVEPLLLKNNQPFMQKTKGTETQIQKIKRMETAQNHSSASQQAAEGAKLAASIATRYKQAGYTPASFAIQSRIPGTEAYNLNKDIETLKSNAFLSRADQMRGLGALTETEGARLVSSVSPLDPMQSSDKFISDLTATAKTFSGIAQSNSEKAKLYANPNGVQQSQSQQNVGSSQSMTTSMTEVRQAAQQMGISVQDAVNMFKAQGVNIQ
ncbi:MAG: hypothetical protein GAK29_04472 [Acinetobacter bereziniae]|uniref:Uncharacterized protein n=1 Tax=Acinetobacter bereziniae TaxID=106648 RepID=A0A833UIY8_ACIBZ|nr:MAG: hypothetical protein GAK29_04472 [Acinetobacter bereziniae]